MEFITEWWKQLLGVSFLIVGGGAVAWLRGSFVTRKEHQALVEQVAQVKATVEELPSSDDIHELDKRLIEVSGKLDAVAPQLDGLKRMTDLLMENELSKNK